MQGLRRSVTDQEGYLAGNDADRAADIAQVIGGSVLDRVLHIVQGAQADLHPEPDHQSKGRHQTGDKGRRAPRQGSGEGIAITVPLPDRDNRVARQVADGRTLPHPQNAHRLAAIFSHRLVQPILARPTARDGGIGITGDVNATGARDMGKEITAPGVRDKIPRAG